ncbi:hypothetical protein [Cohnella boryungensis]|uniref:Uncharacterized protein n=1 Tax=Cohnella boryungensis TaxID=768479 RepID=A0ABV8SGD3_9BACL
MNGTKTARPIGQLYLSFFHTLVSISGGRRRYDERTIVPQLRNRLRHAGQGRCATSSLQRQAGSPRRRMTLGAALCFEGWTSRLPAIGFAMAARRTGIGMAAVLR